jgi:hypothetical protein
VVGRWHTENGTENSTHIRRSCKWVANLSKAVMIEEFFNADGMDKGNPEWNIQNGIGGWKALSFSDSLILKVACAELTGKTKSFVIGA